MDRVRTVDLGRVEGALGEAGSAPGTGQRCASWLESSCLRPTDAPGSCARAHTVGPLRSPGARGGAFFQAMRARGLVVDSRRTSCTNGALSTAAAVTGSRLFGEVERPSFLRRPTGGPPSRPGSGEPLSPFWPSPTGLSSLRLATSESAPGRAPPAERAPPTVPEFMRSRT